MAEAERMYFVVEPAKWAAIKEKLGLTADSGEAEHQKVRIGYEYHDETLFVTVLKKPFYYPTGKVTETIRKEFYALCAG